MTTTASFTFLAIATLSCREHRCSSTSSPALSLYPPQGGVFWCGRVMPIRRARPKGLGHPCQLQGRSINQRVRHPRQHDEPSMWHPASHLLSPWLPADGIALTAHHQHRSAYPQQFAVLSTKVAQSAPLLAAGMNERWYQSPQWWLIPGQRDGKMTTWLSEERRIPSMTPNIIWCGHRNTAATSCAVMCSNG
jgi:hypothetical protein